MGQDPGEVGAQQLDDESQKSPEQLRAEIEETREDLGDTVEALAAKTDVKKRAREFKRAALLKKDELRSKVKPSSSAGDTGVAAAEPVVVPADDASAAGGSSAGPRVKGIVKDNPVPTAAIAAFIGGAAFGRLISRP